MNSKHNYKFIYIIYILLAGILWGFIGLFSTIMTNHGFFPVEIAFVRTSVTAVGMFIYILFKDRKLFCINFRNIWMFFATGIVSIVIFNISYFITINVLNVSLAAILLYTGPFFVVILSSIFFNEKISMQKFAILLMASLGCALTVGVFNGKGSISVLGIITGLLSGLAYGLYSIFGKIALKKYDSYTVIFYTFLIASLSLSVIAIDKDFTSKITSAPAIFASLGIGIVSTIFPFVLYTKGLNNVEAGRASIMTFAEPVVATIIGVSIFGDSLTLLGIFGMLLVFVSLVLLNLRSN